MLFSFSIRLIPPSCPSIFIDLAIRISPSELLPFMPTFLQLLQEENLAVKNVALLMVYSGELSQLYLSHGC